MKKPWYKKWWVWVLAAVISALFSFGIPIVINELYKSNSGYLTLWGADDVLAFYGTFISGIGTAFLGALALWQNRKFKEENDKAQSALKDINDKLLELDIQKRDAETLEQYFKYMEEVQKLFDAQYILGTVKKPIDEEEVLYKIMDIRAKSNSISRRMLFSRNSCADEEFFDYSKKLISEFESIVLKREKNVCSENERNDTKYDKGKEMFEFRRKHAEEFNSKSLEFIYNVNKRINKESTHDDRT